MRSLLEGGRPNIFTSMQVLQIETSNNADPQTNLVHWRLSTRSHLPVLNRRLRPDTVPAEGKVLEQLRRNGVKTEMVEDYDYGRRAGIMDPEGNRIELWEPKKK